MTTATAAKTAFPDIRTEIPGIPVTEIARQIRDTHVCLRIRDDSGAD